MRSRLNPPYKPMNDNMPDLPDNPREAAAYWFARVHSGTFTLAEKQQFNTWRQVNSRHQQEYRALDEIWQATSLIPEAELRDLLAGPQAPEDVLHRLSRRQWIAGGAVVCTLVIGAGISFPRMFTRALAFEASYATVAGEQRSEILPDGSRLEINTRSRILVRFYDDQRHVELLEGEVLFSVAHNAQRPFLVDAGDAAVRVTGTQFNVRRYSAQVDVAVQSGSVEVTAGRWWNRRRATLTASQRTHVQTGKALAVEATDIAELTAWRQGKVVFKEQPLAQVIQEMNRYLTHPIRLTDSRLKGLSMTGVFNVQDAEAFLQALRSALPVAVRMRTDGGADIAFTR
ncbi:FecR family protein [Allopusillimonas ginsengisoli]|nr:FecR family protein [Allopusillimonas ginsengisoli]